MIGIDSNILLRLLTADDPTQLEAVERLLAPFEAVPESILLNNIVLAETFWTLARGYRFDRTAQAVALRHLVETYSFRFEDRDILLQAMNLFETSQAGFADCLIVALNAAAGCEYTASFDEGMSELPGVVRP